MPDFKRNIWLLAVAQALMMSCNSLLIAASGLVGLALADDPSLATLPLALQFFSTMLATIPAAFLMQRIGRRNGYLLAALLGMSGAAFAAWSIQQGWFAGLCLGTVLIGLFNGFAVYYRFAAADQAPLEYKSRAISYVLAGGVAAAFIGPNLANYSQGWIAGTPFLGSYLALVGIYILSFAVVLFLRLQPAAADLHGGGRPLRVIAAQPRFITAVICGMFGYGIMTLVMTATPLAMKGHAHAFGSTAFVIQWHVFAMFVPSFFTGQLIQRFGAGRVMLVGALLDLACVATNLLGHSVTHYWLALFLLGLGWNFLFIGATALLTETYRPEERAKVQASNDFLVHTTVTLASLSAGWLQHHFGWEKVNLGVLPALALILVALWLPNRPRTAPAT